MKSKEEIEKERILRAAADAAAGNVPRRDLAVTSADVEAKKTKPPTETWATAAGAAASRDEILRLAVEAVSGRREEKDATATTGMSESSYDDDYDAVLVVTPDDDIAPEAAPEAAAPEAAAPEAATAMAEPAAPESRRTSFARRWSRSVATRTRRRRIETTKTRPGRR